MTPSAGKTARLAARKSLFVAPTRTTGRPVPGRLDHELDEAVAPVLLPHRPVRVELLEHGGEPQVVREHDPEAPRAARPAGDEDPGDEPRLGVLVVPEAPGAGGLGERTAPGRSPRDSTSRRFARSTAFALTRTSLRPSPSMSLISTGSGTVAGAPGVGARAARQDEAEPVLEEHRARRVEHGEALVRHAPGGRLVRPWTGAAPSRSAKSERIPTRGRRGRRRRPPRWRGPADARRSVGRRVVRHRRGRLSLGRGRRRFAGR